MKKALMVVALSVIVPVTQGCASGEPKQADDIAALKAQVWSLQKQTSELGLKVSYNSDEIALLTERLSVLEEERVSAGFPSAGRAPEAAGVSSPPGKSAKAAEPPAQTAQPGSVPEALGPDYKDLKPEDMYKVSMELFNKGDYKTAIAGFGYLVRRYPGSGLAPNAQYWMGEAFYSEKRYARAGEEFRKVLVRYPESQKASDALLKMAMCKIALNRADEGNEILKRVVSEYPESVAASTAKKLLDETEGVKQ